MRKDNSTIARYFIFLIIVFIVWIVIFSKASKSGNLQTFFGSKDKSLYIINNNISHWGFFYG